MLAYEYHQQYLTDGHGWEGDPIDPVRFKRCDWKYRKFAKGGKRVVVYILDWDEENDQRIELLDTQIIFTS